ncbi:HprK-related kinase A [Sphingorhabdus soli]|uniref:HprK-related kinase A n=1 Tax=Flavisphingopyxis soli TaxID=2601267 RepID=A0A5C6ULH7_9SPHN|nr:HprK-related kinase A [Sphingorhabdus soli]TXC74112.1 HprK-related kinase A [Sphingorhabdus soli]
MRHGLTLKIGPAAFRVGSDWRAPIADLRTLYADYPPAPDGFADFTVRLEAKRPWRRFVRPSVHLGGDYMLPDALPLSLAHGLLAAEMGMNLQMALGWRRHLLIHASAVEKDGRALILTGESGSGKSTLAAMLGERGWRLLGDEFTLLDLDSDSVRGFPRLVSLKNAGIAAVEAVADAARFGPRLEATPKGAIRHLVPRADAIARMDEPAAPALLLYPRYGFDAATRRLAKSENFMRLTQASTNYVALGERGFGTLSRFVESVPALALDYSDGEAGIAEVERLWTEHVG